jgi:hypothetical protein
MTSVAASILTEADKQAAMRAAYGSWVAGMESVQGKHDPVNHPKHYTGHPSGVECIQITEHMGYCLGNAVKYIWRADLKGNAIEDLEKAKWYVEREIARRRALAGELAGVE